MRKFLIGPAVALSFMTLGLVAEAAPANAHPSAVIGEDGDTTDDTIAGSTGGSSGAPSGGVQAGAGGTAVDGASNVAPLLATGSAGLALLGVSVAAARRRRTVKA